MTDEKINSTANNIQIDIDNLSYVNYLWTQRISETSIKGIRLDKRNLPTDTAYISNIPTSLKNPNALKFGSKTYDGSSAQTITASDLGALTSHQDISGKVNKSGDTMSGNLNPSTNKGASLGTSSLYWNDIYGTTIYENGASLANKYLGKTAKAADADKLDGKDSTYYLNYNNLANKPTIPTAGTTASAVSTTASGGSATTWSKSDHVHSISLATGDANGQVKIAGTNVSVKGLGSAAYTNSTAYATSGHTHSFSQITSRGESFLDWGGKNFSGSYGPIDAAMVPELGANRLAFMPANAVTIEYSRDGGSTWTDYGPTDSQKINLFNGLGSSFTIGKATSGAGNIATNKYQLRVNIYTSAGHVYTALNKFVIYLSTSGTNNNWCTIRARKQSDYTAGNDKWTTFADKISVSGWSGYNVINTSGITTYGNTPSTQYGHIQFIFGCDTGSTNNSYAGLNISKIFGFGGVGWTTPSTMAKTGHMYTYDSSQNVTFPAAITSGTINSYNVVPRTNNTYNLGSSSYKWANVYATTIYENGTSLTNKYIAKSLTSTKGDMIYASAANTPAKLGIGSAGQFLSVANGIPTWVNNPNTHNSHAIISGTKSDNSTIKGSASSGDITLGDSGVTAGTYRSVTVNSKGIVVAGSQTDNDTNTWRKIQLDGTDKLGTGINTNPLNIKAGNNMTITESNGTFTFDATDTDTHYINYLQIKGNGTEAVKFTQNANKSLNLKPGSNVSISAASGEITISATVPTKSSWNYDDTYVKYSAAQSLNDTQKTQARTNIGAGTITEIKVNGTSKGTSGSVNLANMVTFASSQTATVAGTSKTTYTYNQPTGDSNTGSSNGSAYFPEGIIMGGTAASAGLVTRGICGVTTPDATTGACTKESLYINYDGTNDYQSNRQLVLQAGSVGTHYGNNLYQYAAARGDAVKNYCDATYAAKSHTHNYVATDTIATSTKLGLVKSLTTGTTANRDYNVQVKSDGTMKVNVPWVDTTYTFNGAVSTIKDSNLTASRALISNGSGKVAVSDITSTELSYLDGANSNIQTQLNTLKGYFNENGYALIAVSASNDADGNEITTTYATQIDLDNTNATIINKQDKLVSGTNLKTINGNSLLGSGNLVITGLPEIGYYSGSASESVNINAPNDEYSMQIGTYGLTLDNGAPADAPDNVFTVNSNTLIWNGYHIPYIQLSNSNYLILCDSNGTKKLQICKGTISKSGSSASATVTLPQSMPNTNYYVLLQTASSYQTVMSRITSKKTTSFTVDNISGGASSGVTVWYYVAICTQ